MKFGFGGYGELELPVRRNQLHDDAVALQSARAAFYLYLSSNKVRKIYIPEYLCTSLDSVFSTLNISIQKYTINSRFLPSKKIELMNDERLVIVNYFGLCDEGISKYLESYSDFSNVIIDNSQALFSPVIGGITTIYSPRKFLGIPDGGFLYSRDINDEPVEFFDSSRSSVHLLLRAAGEINKGYDEFLRAEAALENHEPRKMSKISRRIIDSIELKNVIDRRVNNFTKMHEHFSSINSLTFDLSSKTVPLCYPLKLNSSIDSIWKKLLTYDVYLPRYWEVEKSSSSYEYYDKTLFLPIDQRLDDQDVERLACLIIELINNE
ncbi:hypothetical protein [Vibrio paucivorans]|uniref:DegT/DnrJ/EryC1/StrS aminotransferase family protein n=1 Tax=Vibrio paucivorans TaxID=2829489 RepID=A0A9X3HPR0_9VIBR|nr:hypothetical protein [Vibrio paucivorans]MCW8332814.1 hypothetical protein [Vibrio paucivorans]